MRIESHPEVIIDPLLDAFDEACIDALEDARQVAGRNSRTGRFAQSLTISETVHTATGLEASIGSPMRSAKAKEKGAFIQAKRGKYLTFKIDGQFKKVESVRLAPRPVVAPAGRRFPRYMTFRLRERFA